MGAISPHSEPATTPLHPSAYPWIEPVLTGVLGQTGLREGDDEAGFTPDLSGRLPVVAVGSNAAPTVLRHKLGPLLATGLPVAAAMVEDLLVGHSAHVSARGYVAAAPARGTGAQPVTLAWFDADQLAALDATEPNYRRVPLPQNMPCRTVSRNTSGARMVASSQTPVPGVHIYESVHGVLGQAGNPLSLRPQPEVLEWLATRLPALGHLTHERLQDEALREDVRLGVLEAGLVIGPGGFDTQRS